MNVWSYLDRNSFSAVLLVLVTGWALARLVRAWRERRPVSVRVRWRLVCPACDGERPTNDPGALEVVSDD